MRTLPHLSVVRPNGNRLIDSSVARMVSPTLPRSKPTHFPHFQKMLLLLSLFPVLHPLPRFPSAFSQVAVAQSVQALRPMLISFRQNAHPAIPPHQLLSGTGASLLTPYQRICVQEEALHVPTIHSTRLSLYPTPKPDGPPMIRYHHTCSPEVAHHIPLPRNLSRRICNPALGDPQDGVTRPRAAPPSPSRIYLPQRSRPMVCLRSQHMAATITVPPLTLPTRRTATTLLTGHNRRLRTS